MNNNSGESVRFSNQNTNGNVNRTVQYKGLESDEVESGNSKEDENKVHTNDLGKAVVFGGLDGLFTTFAIISASSGGKVSWNIVLVIGLSCILANALTMGVAEYLSSKAHREYVQLERRRGLWEFRHYKDSEIKQMIKRFQEKGMSKIDSELVVSKMALYENLFVHFKVSEELGLQLPEDNDAFLLTDAFIMFCSYAFFGSLPLLVYFLGILNTLTDQDIFVISFLFTCLLLLALGITKSYYTSISWYSSGLETIMMGISCASVSYAVGSLIVSYL